MLQHISYFIVNGDTDTPFTYSNFLPEPEAEHNECAHTYTPIYIFIQICIWNMFEIFT